MLKKRWNDVIPSLRSGQALSPSLVILSEAKDLSIPLRVNSAKDLFCLFSTRKSRCFAVLNMTNAIFQQPARK
jgi:hypothetical protein